MDGQSQSQRGTRVLGIDPGIRHMGYAVVEKAGTRLVAVAYGVEDVSRERDFQLRIAALDRRIAALAAAHGVVLAGIEKVFAGKNMATALKSAEGRGAVRLSLAQAGIPVAEYAARDIKMAVTGRGGASKQQVAAMVGTILGITGPIEEDAADALAVAITAVQRMGMPAAVERGAGEGDPVVEQLMRLHRMRPRRRSR